MSSGSVRVVIDTNVLLSGLPWRGPPHTLIAMARTGVLTLISSPALITEFFEVITRAKFRTILARTNTNPEQVMAEAGRLTEIVDPLPLPAPFSRDPDDDAVLAAATAAQPDFVVFGDADLLVLGTYAGILILNSCSGAHHRSGSPDLTDIPFTPSERFLGKLARPAALVAGVQPFSKCVLQTQAQLAQGSSTHHWQIPE